MEVLQAGGSYYSCCAAWQEENCQNNFHKNCLANLPTKPLTHSVDGRVMVAFFEWELCRRCFNVTPLSCFHGTNWCIFRVSCSSCLNSMYIAPTCVPLVGHGLINPHVGPVAVAAPVSVALKCECTFLTTLKSVTHTLRESVRSIRLFFYWSKPRMVNFHLTKSWNIQAGASLHNEGAWNHSVILWEIDREVQPVHRRVCRLCPTERLHWS